MSINSVMARNEFITIASRNLYIYKKKMIFMQIIVPEQRPVANKAI